MTTADSAESPSAEPEKPARIRSIEDALRALTGKLILVSTPDSLQSIPTGHQIKPSCYKAKILNVFDGMVVLAAEGSKKRGDEKPATLKQYLPLTVVKRICVGKDDLHLHL